MRAISLASGSKGNATLVYTDKTRLLIDCGLSAKRTDELLKSVNLSLADIDALLLTHEHSDHIKGVKRLMAAYGIPVYATGGTLKSLSRVTGDEYFNYAGRKLMEMLMPDFQLEIGDISILPFSTYHDAADPCGYRFETHEAGKAGAGNDGAKEGGSNETSCSFAILTDCGIYDDYIADHLTELEGLLLEANHDLKMLMSGPYPMHLKRRILSAKGHLSNNASGELLSKIFTPKLKHVLLGHLSQDNNTHKLALETVRKELAVRRGDEALQITDISIAPQSEKSKHIEGSLVKVNSTL
ncbi:MAG: MBL fold metallo-hydrolase [Eubacteriales bacterium]|nr:MBL fold metallo-hydrolase [Eubacteriales bacterium]